MKEEMNMSKIESIWSRELSEYMKERYGIDIDELIVQKIKDFTSTPLCDTITYNKEYDND